MLGLLGILFGLAAAPVYYPPQNPASPYSEAVRAGDLLIVSGQLGVAPGGQAQSQSRQLSVGAPGLEQVEEGQGTGAVHVGEEAAAVPGLALAVVVAGRALRVEPLSQPGEAAHLLHIGFLALRRGLQHGR